MTLTDKHKARIAGTIAFASFVPGFILFRSLAIANFPPGAWLTSVYVAYFVLTIVFAHALAFYLHFDKKAVRGTGLGKQAPRYVDYMVTAVLAIGTVQILHAEGWLARYIHQITDTTPDLIFKINKKAEEHPQKDCGKNPYFTAKYCGQLLEITKQPNLAVYVEQKLVADNDFLDHTIGLAGGPPPGGTGDKVTDTRLRSPGCRQIRVRDCAFARGPSICVDLADHAPAAVRDCPASHENIP